MVVFLLLMLGLCFGSFTEALTWRIHEQAKPKKKRVASDHDLSMSKGRSMCAHCQHTLAWYDLLPLVSWLTLAGKCRYCRKPIGWQAPLLELSTAGLFVLSYVAWPTSLAGVVAKVVFGLWLVLLVGLVALFVYDLRWMLLPDRIVFVLLGVALIQLLCKVIGLHDGLSGLLGALWGFLCLGGLFYGLFQISGGRWIGGGDVKLGFVLGIVVGGPVSAILLLFTASFLGTLVSMPLLFSKRLKESSRIPFGPFLIVAAVIVQLFGASIITWYQHKFLTF